MLAINIKHFIYFCLLTYFIFVNCEEEIKQLPHCKEASDENVAVIVGTLDGKISALNNKGTKLWNVDTGPGPLLISNIHKLELTNNGQWIRIIPSLSGSLYKFDGQKIDAIPINADSLLKSSFLYSDDLVIAGGREVRTYGVAFDSGKLIYECSLSGCQNKTDYETEAEDILVVERSTLTVRAHEPRTGTERWNFSVGLHNIKLPQLSCINTNNVIYFDLRAVVPEGLLIANSNDGTEWKYQFSSPIVTVWMWNGEDMIPVNLFTQKTPTQIAESAALYVGMHNEQLYIHESDKMLNALQVNYGSKTISTIPWKPISATDIAAIPTENDRTTGISVLYSSKYVNGNGFYLFVKENGLCDNQTNSSNKMNITHEFQIYWFGWLQLLVAFLATAIGWNYMKLKLFDRRQITESYEPIEDSTYNSGMNLVLERTKNVSESSDVIFNSRFSNDFETVSCLGKGGFGIVFEVRQKIDECGYAIKRIQLPYDNTSKDKVMREVRILAKLDHQNIVRYYNSWVENPPSGWSIEHDRLYLKDATYTVTTGDNTTTTSRRFKHKRIPSTVIDIDKDSNTTEDLVKLIDAEKLTIGSSDDESHGIYFEDSGSNSQNKEIVNSEVLNKNCTQQIDEADLSTPIFLYIQMQLCQKESLKDWLLQNSTRNYRTVLHIFSQILNAVEYIHNNGLIHRDLKPSNIFFSLEGNIKVGDFGLVTGMEDILENEKQSLQSSMYQSHTRGVGTQLYMSPEQRDGKKYNYKVDIWSLGIIFFELLVPFTTEMEKINTLSDVRYNIYPESFLQEYPDESNLVKGMLCEIADNRPNTTNIKTSPIFWKNFNH